MSVDLRPYKEIGNFRFWCQKTLPLVYDDSLSYYELLCKVVNYLNDVIDNSQVMEENIGNLAIAYNDLETFVNNYFDNLDVQNEINNKLDSMAADGTLSQLIGVYVNPIVEGQNARITVLEGRMDTFASLTEGSTTGDAELTDIRVGAAGFGTYPTAGDAVRGQVSALKEDLVGVKKVEKAFNQPNLANPNKFVVNKYVGVDGTEYESTNYIHTEKISVASGDVIKSTHRARFICAYNGNNPIPDSGVNDATGEDSIITYTVPNGIDGLVFSFKKEYGESIMIYKYIDKDYSYIPFGQIETIRNDVLPISLQNVNANYNKNSYSRINKASLSPNEYLIAPNVWTSLRKNERIVFDCNIASFGIVEIGISSDGASDSGKINRFQISATNVIAYTKWDFSTSTMLSETVNHNLNITGHLQIIVEVFDNATCKLTLMSNGNIFTHTFEWVRKTIGVPYVLPRFSIFSECTLTWECTDLRKDIWLFGDSYFSYSPNRWTYYLHEYDYDKNVLLDGHSGNTSNLAIISANYLLRYGTPKYIIWCLGMNDGSDSSSSPSSNWVTNRDTFLQYCESNNVIPIFATIPTVPTVNNEKKNEWVRNSGYRYIDFAKAVRATPTGQWNDGMLSSDGIHPTEQGARALFARVLVDMPEVMLSR